MTKELKSYMCSVDGEHWTTFNDFTPGKAKSQYLHYLEADFIPYTAVRCRVYGAPYTSEEFQKNAQYRQIPFAYCGMVVKVGENYGVIIGHNNSANLDVLFTTGQYKGQHLNCHPHSNMTYYDKNGNIIQSFLRN